MAKWGVSVAGLERTALALRGRARRHRAATLIVGYSAPYAIYVHEDLTKSHPVGQAKFLEQPARQLWPQLAAMIRSDVRGGRLAFRQALTRAAEAILAVSRILVPVDTGFLRDSGFVREAFVFRGREY